MEFNSDVYVRVPSSNDIGTLNLAIDTMGSDGQTALYDALYTGVVRAQTQVGPKCVLAFTDGEENASVHTLNDVLELSAETATPIFIIGVGDAFNVNELSELAARIGGAYYYAPTSQDFGGIYRQVYAEQKDQYVLTYIIEDTGLLTEWRNVELSCEDENFSQGKLLRSMCQIKGIICHWNCCSPM